VTKKVVGVFVQFSCAAWKLHHSTGIFRPTLWNKETLESFIENCVDGGGFIDDDGGNYMKDGLVMISVFTI
jgi:hypothetical protein